MNKFYIITNSEKDIEYLVSDDIKKFLEDHQKTCFISKQPVKKAGMTYRYTNPSDVPLDTECILVLGGDGTLIQAARDLFGRNIPFIGVNFGTLGYLAEVEKQNLIPALEKLMADEFQIEKRMMLDGTVFREKEKVEKDIALNDIVISRSGSLRVIDFKVYVNGEFLNLYSADGIIISTPTGSTAYNLSAGGPIVSPVASLIVVTPICPRTLNTRSMILSADDIITIEMCPDRNGKEEVRLVSFDGDNSMKVFVKDKIEIKKSEQYTEIIQLNKISFLEVLRRKMTTTKA